MTDKIETTPKTDPTRTPLEVLLVPTRDGGWRARTTGRDGADERVIVREGDCAEELAGLAVGAFRTGGPSSAPPEDQAARRARVEARRAIMGAAAECDDASGLVGFLRGAEAAADFYALAAAVEGVYLNDTDLECSKLACGLDVMVWQAVRALSARETARVFYRALLRAPGELDVFTITEAHCASPLSSFPEHWTTAPHFWAALWLASAGDPEALPGFAGLCQPDAPDDPTPTEEVLVQLVFLACSEGEAGHARGVYDVCAAIASAERGSAAAMMGFCNAVQAECEKILAAGEELEERPAA